MIELSKKVGRLALTASVFSLTGLFDSAVQAQQGTAVVEVNYDDKKPGYDFSVAYGGYQKIGSEEFASLNSLLVKTSKTLTDGGKDGGAFEVALDNSEAEVPPREKRSYAYMGLGAGINGALIDSDLSSFKEEDFRVVFDAKIENGKPMRQSRFELHFITTDGNGPTGDDDKDDDLLCQLNYAGSQSPVKMELNDEFQTIEVELADMSVEKGSIEQIQKFNTRGITLIVIAEDAPERFAIGGDTKLIVDNYRLIKK